MEDSTAGSAAREYLRAAAAGVLEVQRLLSVPSPQNADQSAAILRNVEVQLGCAAAVLGENAIQADAAVRLAVEQIQGEVAVLARFLSESDKMLSGWLQAVQSKRGGYTKRGQAAPLVVVSRMRAEG